MIPVIESFVIFLRIFNLYLVYILCIFLGEICKKDPKLNQDYVCVEAKQCKAFKESIRTRNYLDICKFVSLQPIVCCPTKYDVDKPLTKIPENENVNSISANESMFSVHCARSIKCILKIKLLCCSIPKISYYFTSMSCIDY